MREQFIEYDSKKGYQGHKKREANLNNSAQKMYRKAEAHKEAAAAHAAPITHAVPTTRATRTAPAAKK